MSSLRLQPCTGAMLLLLSAGTASAQHVPPDPPQQLLPHQSYEQMAQMMRMDDRERYGRLTVDQLEWQDASDAAMSWDAQAFYGGDYDKLWLKSEGTRAADNDEIRVEALWNRIVTPWWNLQAGVRHDFSDGPSRNWLALGIEGLAPHWFEIEVAVYVGDAGRTALRADVSYDLLLTQRLVLQPQIEIAAYGEDDRERGIGSGWSDVEAGLRLRYELRREIAPYIGVHWRRLFGATADLAGDDSRDARFVAGLRIWF
jgi:copper resistance protein B